MKTKILVVSHKDFDTGILPRFYQVIKVSNCLSDEEAIAKGFLVDSKGDNISSKNPFYCELTALYWAWKNLKDLDYIGITHYRRYFVSYSLKRESIKDSILTCDEIENILRKYKIILPFRIKKVPLEESETHVNEVSPFPIIRQILNEHYRQYLTSFDRIIKGNSMCFQNLMVTSKTYFDQYSEWLFFLLEQFDNECKKRGIERIPRWDGFISEYLLNVWVDYNFTENDIYRSEVGNTENCKNGAFKVGLISRIIKSNQCLDKVIRNLIIKFH